MIETPHPAIDGTGTDQSALPDAPCSDHPEPDEKASWWHDLENGGEVVIYPAGEFVPQTLHLRVDGDLYVFASTPGPKPIYVRALALTEEFKYPWSFATETWMRNVVSRFGIRLADDTTTSGVVEALTIETEAFPQDVFNDPSRLVESDGGDV